MKKLSLAVIAALLLQTHVVQAWHDKGHQTVAAIAWDQMTPAARTQAAALLRNAPEDSGIRGLRPSTGSEADRDRAQFIRVASWADDVRPDDPRATRYHHGPWHYGDYFWEQLMPGGPKRQRPDMAPSGDLVPILKKLDDSLQDLRGNHPVSPSKATDLAWFIHLMGDISQPLHCSGRVTSVDAHGDEGGNKFCLSPGRTHDGKCLSNLHSFWDHMIEREFGDGAVIGQVATAIEANSPRTPFTRLSLGHYEDWAHTSQKIAMQVAYPVTLERDHTPPAAYQDLVKRVSKKVIALAGYRLGEALNAAWR